MLQGPSIPFRREPPAVAREMWGKNTIFLKKLCNIKEKLQCALLLDCLLYKGNWHWLESVALQPTCLPDDLNYSGLKWENLRPPLVSRHMQALGWFQSNFDMKYPSISSPPTLLKQKQNQNLTWKMSSWCLLNIVSWKLHHNLHNAVGKSQFWLHDGSVSLTLTFVSHLLLLL